MENAGPSKGGVNTELQIRVDLGKLDDSELAEYERLANKVYAQTIDVALVGLPEFLSTFAGSSALARSDPPHMQSTAYQVGHSCLAPKPVIGKRLATRQELCSRRILWALRPGRYLDAALKATSLTRAAVRSWDRFETHFGQAGNLVREGG